MLEIIVHYTKGISGQRYNTTETDGQSDLPLTLPGSTPRYFQVGVLVVLRRVVHEYSESFQN